MKSGWVYIMANRRNGTIYVGSTSNLAQRAHQHREGEIDGFTKDHGCKLLVWYEGHDNLHDARAREVQIKKWMRSWKIRLIEEMNPDWRDLWWDLNKKPLPAVFPCEGRGPSPGVAGWMGGASKSRRCGRNAPAA